MPLPVIPALFKELADERRRKGAPRSAVAEKCGVTEQTVERWELLANLPLRAKTVDPGGDLARAVDGYAEVTNKSPFTLWTAALKRAKRERAAYEETLKSQPPRPSPRAKRAVGALRPPKGS